MLQTRRPIPWTVLAALALAVVVGCEEGAIPDGGVEIHDLTVELSTAIATVATVSWAVDGGSVEEAHVDFGRDGEWEYRAPASCDADAACEAVLLGMKPGTEYEFQVSVVADGESEVAPSDTITTGHAPNSIPDQILDVPHPELACDGFILTTLIPGPAVILDSDLDPVWWWQSDATYVHFLNRLQFSTDGQSLHVLLGTTLPQEGVESSTRKLVEISLDGTSVELDERPMLHREYTVLPDGNLAALMFDPRDVDGVEYVGDRLVEVRPDGSEVDIWSIWDTEPHVPGVTFPDNEWGHCNAVDYDPDEDAYYVGSSNFNTVYKIDRTTGETLFRIGRSSSDFLLAEDDQWFENQHQFQFLDDGMMIFDNGAYGVAGATAREYALDEASWQAEQTWSFQPEPPLMVVAFGDVVRLDNGHTLISWGGSGRLDEVTADGDLVRRMDLELANGIGYITWLDSLY